MLFNFDLYIFDLDGTIILSEEYHYKAYCQALQDLEEIHFDFTWKLYQKHAHTIDPLLNLESFFKLNGINYPKLYAQKEIRFLKYINEGNIQLVKGFSDFLHALFLHNKNICICTNASASRCEALKNKIPLLSKITTWITKDTLKHKKPHPECWLRAMSVYHNVPQSKIIFFEDSLCGFHSLDSFEKSTKVIFVDPSYYYYKEILAKKPSLMISNYTDIFDTESNTETTQCQLYLSTNHPGFNDNFNIYLNTENSASVSTDVNTSTFKNKIYPDFYTSYMEQFQKIIPDIEMMTLKLTPLILSCKSRIYFFGIGKSGNVCQKAVSNLRSYGVQAYVITVNELFHGDFGIIQYNDLVVYLSKSGNTIELVQTATYIKQHFKSVLQVSITNSNENMMKQWVDFNFVLGKMCSIVEADHINMAPTVSSAIMMIALDRLCVEVCKRKDITRHIFQLYHPGGNLGGTPTYIDYVVCVASGESSRLFPYTKYIPKLLLNVSNNTVIEHLVGYWKTYCKKFVFIVNNNHKELIRCYLDKIQDIEYTLICHDKADGTASAVFNSLNNIDYLGKNLLFTWSDIYPAEAIPKDIFNSNIIFLHGNKCRYNFDKNDKSPIRKCENGTGGNIIGMYYIKNFQIDFYSPLEDLVNVIARSNIEGKYTLEGYNIDSIIDVGDLEKYHATVKNQSRLFDCRFFNRISSCVSNENHFPQIPCGTELIVKESIHEKGDVIINREMNWYRFTDQFDFVPKVYQYNPVSFVMKRKSGTALYKHFWTINEESQIKILQKIILKLQVLHANTISMKTKKGVILDDMEIEFQSKIIKRLDCISPILNTLTTILLSNQIISINNIRIDFSHGLFSEQITMECFTRLKWNLLSTDYSLIHGDCQFSNTLYDVNLNELSFIDPRGYFGNTYVYGYKGYDYGKIAYALSGYDLFNDESYLFSINVDYNGGKDNNDNNNNIQLDIPLNFDNLINVLADLTNSHVNDLIAMMCVNWLGLAEYFSNNPLKSMGALLYAHYFYSKYLSKSIYD